MESSELNESLQNLHLNSKQLTKIDEDEYLADDMDEINNDEESGQIELKMQALNNQQFESLSQKIQNFSFRSINLEKESPLLDYNK